MLREKFQNILFSDTISAMGLSGLLKSGYLSQRHTGRPDSLLLSRNVMAEIKDSAQIDISGRFAVGILYSGASHPYLQKSKLNISNNSTVCINAPGGSASIGPGSVVHIEGEFSMGNSYINSHARILCGDKITIGNECSIAWNVQIIDDNRHSLSIDGKRRPQTRPISIADDVWIGHDVTIKKGVKVGKGAVIGSNSVVTKNVPPHVLATGSPATVVSENIEWGF